MVDELYKLTNGVLCLFIIGVLAIFGQIFASFTPPVGSLAAFLPEFMVGRYSPFRITQKIVPVLKYDESLRIKLTKIVKFEVNLGYQFWTN